jgi:hypothetical protein
MMPVDAMPIIDDIRGREDDRGAGRLRQKLTSIDERAIVEAAPTRSLRELATEYGVSHETIRSMLRRAELDSIPRSRNVRSLSAA